MIDFWTYEPRRAGVKPAPANHGITCLAGAGFIPACTLSRLTGGAAGEPLNSGRNSRGFTLLELVVVLIILSISAALLIPRVGAGWKRMEDREFLQEFTQTLRSARLVAMNSGEVVVFRLRGSERTYGIRIPPEKAVPVNVDIFADNLERDPQTNDNVVLFYPDGSFSGRDIQVVFDQQRSFFVSVHPITGAIQLSRKETP